MAEVLLYAPHWCFPEGRQVATFFLGDNSVLDNMSWESKAASCTSRVSVGGFYRGWLVAAQYKQCEKGAGGVSRCGGFCHIQNAKEQVT